MDKNTMLLHIKIINRAREMGIMRGDTFTLTIDLEAATKHFDLDCQSLLEADDFNFAHDICGIQQNINREKTCMYAHPPVTAFENCFVPRFARK